MIKALDRVSNTMEALDGVASTMEALDGVLSAIGVLGGDSSAMDSLDAGLSSMRALDSVSSSEAAKTRFGRNSEFFSQTKWVFAQKYELHSSYLLENVRNMYKAIFF